MLEIKWHTAPRATPPTHTLSHFHTHTNSLSLFPMRPQRAPPLTHVNTRTRPSLVTPRLEARAPAHEWWCCIDAVALKKRKWGKMKRKAKNEKGKSLAASASRDDSGPQWQIASRCQGDFPKQFSPPPTNSKCLSPSLSDIDYYYLCITQGFYCQPPKYARYTFFHLNLRWIHRDIHQNVENSPISQC